MDMSCFIGDSFMLEHVIIPYVNKIAIYLYCKDIFLSPRELPHKMSKLNLNLNLPS